MIEIYFSNKFLNLDNLFFFWKYAQSNQLIYLSQKCAELYQSILFFINEFFKKIKANIYHYEIKRKQIFLFLIIRLLKKIKITHLKII